MTSVSTITAISRHETGQFCKASARDLGKLKTVDFLARFSVLAER